MRRMTAIYRLVLTSRYTAPGRGKATMGRPLKPWLPKETGQPREIRSAVGYIRVSTADQARGGNADVADGAADLAGLAGFLGQPRL